MSRSTPSVKTSKSECSSVGVSVAGTTRPYTSWQSLWVSLRRRSAGMPLIRLPNSHPGRTFLGKLTNKKKTAFIYFSSFSFEVLSCTGWAERSRCSDWTITQSVAGIRQKRKYKKKFSGVKSPYPKYKKSKMAENCAAWKAVFFHRSLTVSNCFLTPSLFREGYVSSSSERFSVQWDCEDPLRSTCVSGESRLMCRARRTNCLKLKGREAQRILVKLWRFVWF